MWSKRALNQWLPVVEVGVGRVESFGLCFELLASVCAPLPTPRDMLGSAKSRKLLTKQIVV